MHNINNKLSYLTLLVTTIWRQNTKHEMQHGWNGVPLDASAFQRFSKQGSKGEKGNIFNFEWDSNPWPYFQSFSPPMSRTGYRKPRSARFDDEFLKSRPRYACQPIDIAWGNYLLNRLQNFKSLAYHTLADCRPFHPVQAECFQGTGVCLNCSTHTSTPRSDEAFESHATGLDQT